jgi:hypothetical protein
MSLQPGCRFVIAPRFYLPADWSQRFLVGEGVVEAEGGFYPREAWRPPTADELANLLRPSDGPTSSEEAAASLCLFRLPEHLRSGWWDLLERAAGDLGEGRLPGFEAFVNQVVEFLTFKDLPDLGGARCSLVVSKPGQRSAGWGPGANQPEGLRCNLAANAPWRGAEEWIGPRLWGGINLGDEDTSVVLIDRPCRQLDAELRGRFPDGPTPKTVGALVERFLRTYPDYPPVRLLLRSGEGFRLPREGLILDGYPADKQEPDVMLLFFHEETSPV